MGGGSSRRWRNGSLLAPPLENECSSPENSVEQCHRKQSTAQASPTAAAGGTLHAAQDLAARVSQARHRTLAATKPWEAAGIHSVCGFDGRPSAGPPHDDAPQGQGVEHTVRDSRSAGLRAVLLRSHVGCLAVVLCGRCLTTAHTDEPRGLSQAHRAQRAAVASTSARMVTRFWSGRLTRAA